MDAKIKESIKKAYKEGTLQVLSSNEFGIVESKKIEGVVKHRTPHKTIYKTTLENMESVVTTEDHSLYKWGGDRIVEVLASELSVGDELVVYAEGDYVGVLSIISIEEQGTLEYTYDLSVADNHNFFLSSGILAHNTYSISGVSLDLEKSSKYQGMKENFENEFDKLKDQAKRSIKIVKGLQQPRYGIGISSALGPFSRQGVQSRRNYVSSGGGWS